MTRVVQPDRDEPPFEVESLGYSIHSRAWGSHPAFADLPGWKPNAERQIRLTGVWRPVHVHSAWDYGDGVTTAYVISTRQDGLVHITTHPLRPLGAES